MKCFDCPPVPALRFCIDRLWGWKVQPGESVRLPVLLPGTGAELYFHLGAPFQFLSDDGAEVITCTNAHLLCRRRKLISLLPNAALDFIAVRIKTGMLHRFVGTGGEELADRVVSAEDIWDQRGRALLQQLGNSDNTQQQLQLIQMFLLEQLRNKTDAAVEHAAALLYARHAELRIESLAQHVQLGRRHLERRFQRTLGLTPAGFKGLARFQHTVRTAMLDTDIAPFQAALEHGYYDQAHFNRDFMDRTGYTPGRFFREARNRSHFYKTSLGARDNMGRMI